MNQPVESVCIFSSYLKIPYDKRFISMATDAVRNLAEMSGADETEVYHLAMLVEESVVFIIDKYIDDKLKAHIEVGYLLFDDSRVVLELSDMGSPIHQEKIPEFNINEEGTEDGLWYHMVCQMSDSFEVVNRLNMGWLIRIEKAIKNVSFALESFSAEGASGKDEKITTRMASPVDAGQLIDLVFMTYRYSNAIPEYYDASTLAGHIEEGLYDIFTGEAAGKIIASASIKYQDANGKTAEFSGGMVHPDFRGTKAALYVMADIIRYHAENPRNSDFFVSYLVTSHPRSQKMAAKINYGYKPLSISPNIIPKPDFIGMKDIAGARETLLNAYYFHRPLETDVIHVPEAHAVIAEGLIGNAGGHVRISTETAPAADTETVIDIEPYTAFSSAFAVVKTIGADWYPRLCRSMLSLASAGAVTVVVNLPSDRPLPADMDEKLAELGMIFCGFRPFSLDDVKLAYVFSGSPVGFDSIQLSDPFAVKLLEHMRAQYLTGT